MNPRARRIRRQHRKDRVRDAVAAKDRLMEQIRRSRERERSTARVAAHRQSKETGDPLHALRVQSQIATGTTGLEALFAKQQPKV